MVTSPTGTAPLYPTLRASVSSNHSASSSNRDVNTVRESTTESIHETEGGDRSLEQYVLLEELGRGSFGTVYRAKDKNTGVFVAAKELDAKKLSREKLSKAGASGPGGRGGMFRGRGRGSGAGSGAGSTHSLTPQNPIDLVRGEIAIMKKLRHENVVRLYDVIYVHDSNSLFMVYELGGKSLMDVSGDTPARPYPEREAREIFQQLVLGIEYLHEHGIAHRGKDILFLPDNLLISDKGVLKIVDFGVSEMFSDGNDRSKRSAGTHAFFAPEMCMARHGELSAKATDIWAMGVTLFCMLFGRLPFQGASIPDLYEAIRSKPLNKDPVARCTMDDIRVHPWVTDHGSRPLLSKADNVQAVSPVTEEDVANAVRKIDRLRTIVLVKVALKKFRSSTRLASASASPSPTPPAGSVEGLNSSSSSSSARTSASTSSASLMVPPRTDSGAGLVL
ncbi:kinase-like domain-containing protein [Zopfochytrium polystomum]|nr:kinase-like domain-containing protein [Zopfochytrium polystomum]